MKKLTILDNSDIPEEDMKSISTNQQTTDDIVDIGKLIDIDEFSPNKNSLENYIGQLITVIGFEDTQPKIFKKVDRDTIVFRFIDEKQKLREIMTSAKHIVQLCHELHEKIKFGTKESKVYFKGVLLVKGRNKRFRSYYITNEAKAKQILAEENKYKKNGEYDNEETEGNN